MTGADELQRLEAAIDANIGPFPRNALNDAKALTEFCPGRPNAWRQLGRVFYKLGDFDQAVLAFDRGLRLSPQSDLESKLLIGKASSLMNRGQPDDYKDAEALLADTLRRHPDQELAWKNLAVVRMHLGRYDEAYTGFLTQAKKADTEAERAFANVGLGAIALVKGVDGVSYLLAALCLRPDLRPFFETGERKYIDGWDFGTFALPLKASADRWRKLLLQTDATSCTR